MISYYTYLYTILYINLYINFSINLITYKNTYIEFIEKKLFVRNMFFLKMG